MRTRPLSPAKAAVATALIAGAAFASALPAGAQVGDDSPPVVLEIESPAVRKTRGAVVEVTFKVNCRVPTRAILDVTFTQRIRSTVKTVHRQAWPLCTGEEQQVTVGVEAVDIPFVAKSAYVQARLGRVSQYDNVTSRREVEVVNG
ncbi:hypothetical protein ACFV4N_10710 [Actinosynnema sp. NPDC059797]